jgi:hypothetical protein
MPELTLQNIEQITRDVSMQEISFSHLADELIDHVCCDVEQEMRNGLNFLEAYSKVNGKMGLRRLKKIQEETLYAVDTKYRKMKNTMKISGVSGTIMLGFAALFKIMHWPGAGIMMLLGGLLLAFVFMPSALVVLWKETHNKKRIFLYISAFISAMFFILGTVFKVQHWPGAGFILLLAGVSGMLCFIPVLLIGKLNQQESNPKKAIYIFGAVALVLYISGLLFKIQHWPGSGILMITALVILFFVVFPWYTVTTWKNEPAVKAVFLFMVIGSLAIVTPSSLINMNLQKTYESGYYLNQHEQQALFECLYIENRSFVDKNNDISTAPVLKQIASRTNELLQVINGVEAKMIAEAEGEPGAPADVSGQVIMTENGQEIQFNKLLRPFSPVRYNDILKYSSSTGKKLDEALKDYSLFISGLAQGSESDNSVTLVDPSVFFSDNESDEKMVSLMSALHMTALLKNSIMAVESRALKAAVKQ